MIAGCISSWCLAVVRLQEQQAHRVWHGGGRLQWQTACFVQVRRWLTSRSPSWVMTGPGKDALGFSSGPAA